MEKEQHSPRNPPEQGIIVTGKETRTGKRPVRKDELCPVCGIGVLDYNGMLDLECPVCAFTEGPGGGCT